MHHYKLGYWTHDGHAAIELVHERAYSPEAFRALGYAAVAAVLRNERVKPTHYPFAWIYDTVADRLVAESGFQRVVYSAEFEIYGSGSILEGDPLMPDLEALTAYLRDEGLA